MAKRFNITIEVYIVLNLTLLCLPVHSSRWEMLVIDENNQVSSVFRKIHNHAEGFKPTTELVSHSSTLKHSFSGSVKQGLSKESTVTKEPVVSVIPPRTTAASELDRKLPVTPEAGKRSSFNISYDKNIELHLSSQGNIMEISPLDKSISDNLPMREIKPTNKSDTILKQSVHTLTTASGVLAEWKLPLSSITTDDTLLMFEADSGSQSDDDNADVSNSSRPTDNCQTGNDQHQPMWRPARVVSVPLPLTVPKSCVWSSQCRVSTVLDQHVSALSADLVQVVFSVKSPETRAIRPWIQLHLHSTEPPQRHLPGAAQDGTRSHLYCDALQPSKLVLTVAANSRGLIPRRLLSPGKHVFYGRVNGSLDECFTMTVEIKGAECGPGNACSGHGHCLLAANQVTYRCRCCHGYTGSFCQIEETCSNMLCVVNRDGPCQPDQCHCVETTDKSSICRRNNSLSPAGSRFGVEVSPCSRRMCRNGGTCISRQATFSCHCPRGYAGHFCQLRVLPMCAIYPCYNGGTCTNNGTRYHCTCTAAHTGKHCEGTLSSAVFPGHDDTERQYRKSMARTAFFALCCVSAAIILLYMRVDVARRLWSLVNSVRLQLKAKRFARKITVKGFVITRDEQRKSLLELGLSVNPANSAMAGGICDVPGSGDGVITASSLQWSASSMTAPSTAPVHLWQCKD